MADDTKEQYTDDAPISSHKDNRFDLNDLAVLYELPAAVRAAN